MPKLHEVLAVEADRKKTAEAMLEESKVTFEKRADHFTELRKTYKPDNEAETGLQQPVEVKAMVDTVTNKLKYLSESQINLIDVIFQKELTNTHAKADVALEDGTVLLEKVPAVVLLGLETRLKLLREVFMTIPTLQPGEEWERTDEGYYQVVDNKVRTKKVFKNHVIAPATDKHPAQVQVYSEDVREGLATTVKTTSVLSPGDKSTLLGRLDALQRAVKTARQRANSTEVVVGKIGGKIFDFLYNFAAN